MLLEVELEEELLELLELEVDELLLELLELELLELELLLELLELELELLLELITLEVVLLELVFVELLELDGSLLQEQEAMNNEINNETNILPFFIHTTPS